MPDLSLATEQDLLERGLAELSVAAPGEVVGQLMHYLQALVKWNRAYNLTAVRDPRDMVVRHLLDSAALAPWLRSDQRVLDIGTGAGLPGVVLAILVPGLRVTCLDSNGKKIRFIRHVGMDLGLDRVTPVQARIEAFDEVAAYDRITSRAFAAMHDTIASSQQCLRQGGQYLFMKGQLPESELAALDPVCEVLAAEPLAVPGLAEQRHLVRIGIGPQPASGQWPQEQGSRP